MKKIINLDAVVYMVVASGLLLALTSFAKPQEKSMDLALLLELHQAAVLSIFFIFTAGLGGLIWLLAHGALRRIVGPKGLLCIAAGALLGFLLPVVAGRIWGFRAFEGLDLSALAADDLVVLGLMAVPGVFITLALFLDRRQRRGGSEPAPSLAGKNT